MRVKQRRRPIFEERFRRPSGVEGTENTADDGPQHSSRNGAPEDGLYDLRNIIEAGILARFGFCSMKYLCMKGDINMRSWNEAADIKKKPTIKSCRNRRKRPASCRLRWPSTFSLKRCARSSVGDLWRYDRSRFSRRLCFCSCSACQPRVWRNTMVHTVTEWVRVAGETASSRGSWARSRFMRSTAGKRRLLLSLNA